MTIESNFDVPLIAALALKEKPRLTPNCWAGTAHRTRAIIYSRIILPCPPAARSKEVVPASIIWRAAAAIKTPQIQSGGFALRRTLAPGVSGKRPIVDERHPGRWPIAYAARCPQAQVPNPKLNG